MISVGEFLNKIRYRSKYVSKDFDGCVLVQFRDFKGFSANLEFGTTEVADRNGHRGQDVYFEILDMRDYREGDVISIDSSTRKCVLHGIMDKANVGVFADHVNKSLGKMYSGKLMNR